MPTGDGPLLYDAGARRFLTAASATATTAEAVAFDTSDFQVLTRNGDAWLAPRVPGVAIDHVPVLERTKLQHRALIVNGRREAYLFLAGEDPGLGSPEEAQQWILAMLQRRAGELRTRTVAGDEPPFPALPESLALHPGRNVIGRDSEAATIVVPGVQVSRTHAVIDWDGRASAVLRDLRSFNGTFVNGDRVRAPVELEPGDRIDIGPVTLIYAGDRLTVQSTGETAELVARGVTFDVPDGQKRKTLLDDVTVTIRPHEFTVIIGPSGCGKSLLLKAMGGRLSPTAGAVYVNRSDVEEQFESLKRTIGYVPQRDVLHEALRLDCALDYSARLRLPDDLSDADRQQCVQGMVHEIQLDPHVHTRISRLSGGQARRASLANEMLPQPALLLLDEVTSGLDEETDGGLMRLLRQFADRGKTVVCVTHNLTHVVDTANRLIVLAPQGRLAYFGTPAGALEYFGVERLGDIYPLLRQDPEQWRGRYLESVDCDRYVRQRMPLLLTSSGSDRPRRRRGVRHAVSTFLREWRLLSLRTAQVKAAQPRWLALLALQCVGLALLIGWLFGNVTTLELSAEEQAALRNAPQLLAAKQMEELNRLPAFLRSQVEQGLQESQSLSMVRWTEQKRGTMALRLLIALVLCAMWLGCNNSSAEIVRERSIFESEREAGVGVLSYEASKLLMLGLTACAQILVLLGLARWLTHLPGAALPQAALMCLVGLVGVALGLAISAWSRTSEVSTALVPIFIISQILLAGTMVPLEGLAQTLADWFVPLHWGYRGLVAQLLGQGAYSEKTVELLRLVGALRDYPVGDAQTAWRILTAHAVVLGAVCYLGLRVTNPWDAVRHLLRR